jgi:uncharacterized membrane protein HdeD (DUF308 family)
MSDSDNAPVKPPRHGCLTAIMVLAGIVLLLPGVCTLLVSGGDLRDPLMSTIALITFFVFVGGIVLIAQALRGKR